MCVQVWNVDTGELKYTFQGHSDMIRALSCSKVQHTTALSRTAYITQHTAHSTLHSTQHSAHNIQLIARSAACSTHTARTIQRSTVTHSTQQTANSPQPTALNKQHSTNSAQHSTNSKQHSTNSKQHSRDSAICWLAYLFDQSAPLYRCTTVPLNYCCRPRMPLVRLLECTLCRMMG